MKHSFALALLMAASVVTPALASDPQSRPEKSTKEEKICQRLVPTGSMLPIKTCRTKAEWERLSASGQGTLRQVKDHSQATLGSPSND